MENLLSAGYLTESELLHVVNGLTGDVIEASWNNLLDRDKYDTLLACSYVSSPRFIADLMQGFERARVILGIDSHKNLSAIRDKFSPKSIEAFNSLTDEQRDKIITGELAIHYTREKPIHSKFYLLSHSETKQLRVITGSANATDNATSRTRGKKQFEEIQVFDNSRTHFETYYKRFQYLWEYESANYVSELLMKSWELDRRLLNMDDVKDLVINVVNQAEDPQAREMLVLSKEQYEELQKKIFAGDDEISDADKNAVAVYSAIMNPKNVTVRPAGKIKHRLEELFVRQMPLLLSNIKDEKSLGQYWFSRQDPSTDKQYLFAGNWPEIQEEKYIGKGLYLDPSTVTTEDLRREIFAIHDMVESYGKYTIRTVDVAYRAKIYDAIVYALSAPLLCNIRELVIESQSSSDFQRIPLYLILGGEPGCGKTSLLQFLYTLLTGEVIDSSDIQYKKIQSTKLFGGRCLDKAFDYGNRFPMFVDEFELNYFNHGAYTNKFKECANTTTLKDRDGYAPMILTGNASSFQPARPIHTRVKYCEMNEAFYLQSDLSKEKAAHGKACFTAILESVKGDLARVFLDELATQISLADCESYQLSIDPMCYSRKVLINLYANLGIDIPEYFPYQMTENSVTQSQVELAMLFRDNHNRAAITYINGDTKIRIDLNKLTSTNSTKKDIKTLRETVPVSLLVSGSQQSSYLVVWAKPFLKWVNSVLPLENCEKRTIPERWREWRILRQRDD